MTLSAATAATAAGTRWIPLGFEAAYSDAACAGPAFTVLLTAGDNLPLHRALELAPEGHVIVAAARGDGEAGHWGGLMTRAAIARGLGGLVIDGSIRDVAELRRLGFPVFFRSTCPRKARKSDPGTVGDTIELGGVTIATGDLVVADEDGVVIVPAAIAGRVRAEAEAIAGRESEIEQAFDRGEIPTLAP